MSAPFDIPKKIEFINSIRTSSPVLAGNAYERELFIENLSAEIDQRKMIIRDEFCEFYV